jgi:uncharacterized protein YbjT (DUF2867 family)
MASKRTVLVTGSTGKQGGAVARALLSRGHNVRALTRKPDSVEARQLAEKGAELVEGDLADGESLKRAAVGVDTVYAMGTPFLSGLGAEVQQGIAIAVAAKAAGVGHLIYGSVSDADRQTGIPHFDSKYRVERYVTSLGVPYTISAPVYFMENLMAPSALQGLRDGKLALPLPARRALQQIALSDIGGFVAALTERREAVFGKRFNIAGDELSGEEMAAILSRVGGRPIRYEGSPAAGLRALSEDVALMYEWFDRVGYTADIKGLRREFPEVSWHRFEEWAREQDWNALL